MSMRHALIGLVLVGAFHQAPLDGQEPTLATVLSRAALYVEQYERDLGTLIAEEGYVQRAPLENPQFSSPSRGGFYRPSNYERRRMRSDFLMLRLASAGEQWVGFRVVVEVDGRTIRDRMERLQSVLGGTREMALDQWRALAEESARFNIGSIIRNTNVPTFALVILKSEYQDRFEFEHVDDDEVEGLDVWVIWYRERRSPTLIADPFRRADVPVHGHLWVDPADGRLVRTELRTGDDRAAFRSEITVRYQPNDDLGVWVPRDMRERYDGREGMLFEGNATYSDFQQFGVSVDTAVPEETPVPNADGR